MRLIDADKLLEDLKQKRYSKQSLELIQKQPEIAAAPIYFIDKLERTVFAWIPHAWSVCEKIKKEWEKENG